MKDLAGSIQDRRITTSNTLCSDQIMNLYIHYLCVCPWTCLFLGYLHLCNIVGLTMLHDVFLQWSAIISFHVHVVFLIQVAFNHLSELCPGSTICRVRMHVSRLWLHRCWSYQTYILVLLDAQVHFSFILSLPWCRSLPTSFIIVSSYGFPFPLIE